jgi:hypothetical protein
MLHRRSELAELADLVPMNLIEGYEQPGAVLGEEICEQCHLVPQTGTHQMSLDDAPGRAARAERSGDAT